MDLLAEYRRRCYAQGIPPLEGGTNVVPSLGSASTENVLEMAQRRLTNLVSVNDLGSMQTFEKSWEIPLQSSADVVTEYRLCLVFKNGATREVFLRFDPPRTLHHNDTLRLTFDLKMVTT